VKNNGSVKQLYGAANCCCD